MGAFSFGTLSFELALTFYLAASLTGIVALMNKSKTILRAMFMLAGLGFLAHTLSIINRYAVSGQIPVAVPHEAASFFAWCIILLFFVMELRYRIGIMGSFIIPVSFFLMLSAAMFARDIKPLSPALRSNWLGIHTLFAFLGNAAFAMAFGTGLMYLLQEHYVKSKRLGELFGRLPSLQVLDRINYRLITVGFPLLTLAIITGAVWAESAWGSYWRWDAREVWALITWFIYAIILHARLLAGWRGKKAAVLSILGFVTILVAFFGIKLLRKGMHVF